MYSAIILGGGWLDEWRAEQLDEWTDGWRGRGGMDEQTDGRANGWMVR
jgi:hypothetical protein